VPPVVFHTELVKTEDEEGFVDFESQNLGLEKTEWLSVDLNESLASLDIQMCQILSLNPAELRVRSSAYLAMCDSCKREVLAEPFRSGHLLINIPVAVFFLPKHCTLCVEVILAGVLSFSR
jgi:hypothetical protein